MSQLDGGISRVLRVPYDGKYPAERVPLPFEASVFLGSWGEPRIPGVLLVMSSWTKAFKIYSYDPVTKQATDTRLSPSGPFDDPPDVESVEVKVKSWDGTMIPLSIVYKRGLKLDGSHPALLEGYGAAGISSPPMFDPKRLAWLERGGVWAVAHVRGGGEYGEEWHQAGMKLTKPNTWRDFIACAEFLVEKGYTSGEQLAAWGASAGGITIGRAIAERPDLFAAAVVQSGVFDMLRIESTLNGVFTIPEYGSVKAPEGLKGLLAMSPYHHITDRAHCPAFLAMASMNDTNVDPWHAAKMTARLQAATASGKPVLLRLDEEGGHGIAATKTQEQVKFADQLAFLFWQLGVPEFQPSPGAGN